MDETSGTTVLDDTDTIRAVLTADPQRLAKLLTADVACRRALRHLPNNPNAERLRTLVAAARVEHRRRTAAAALADALKAAS